MKREFRGLWGRWEGLEEKAAEYGIGPDGFAADPPDKCEMIFAKKLAYYKSLYNLPRGYFKSS